MKPFPIPVVALGPGSQALEEPLEFMQFPQQMATFVAPSLPDDSDARVVSQARAILEDLLQQAGRFDFGPAAVLEFDLAGTDPKVLRYLGEALSEGEVAAVVRPAGVAPSAPPVTEIRIQETAFPAFWRVVHLDTAGRIVRDLIEVGPIPSVVTAAALAASHAGVTLRPFPDGVMNAAPILAELAAASARFADSGEGHIVNFTLLPVSPVDMQCLVDSLGIGAVSILSRGYGNCRLTSTRLRHVWWVQYFNSMDQMILNTIEVTAVPEVGLASRDDFTDSLARIAEWIQTLE